jgi:hypothetical protein
MPAAIGTVLASAGRGVGSCRIKRRDEEALPACSSRSHIAQMLVGLDDAKSIERLAYRHRNAGWCGHEQMHRADIAIFAASIAHTVTNGGGVFLMRNVAIDVELFARVRGAGSGRSSERRTGARPSPVLQTIRVGPTMLLRSGRFRVSTATSL